MTHKACEAQPPGIIAAFEAYDIAPLPAEAKRRAFLERMSFNSYLDLLDTIQASVCPSGYNLMEYGFDVPNVVISADSEEATDYQVRYVTPEPRNKLSLMKDAWDVMRQQTDLGRAATLGALNISVVHPLSDGNGRVSRVLYSLLTRGYDASPDDIDYYNHISAPKSREVLSFSPNRGILPGLFMRRACKARDRDYLTVDSQPILAQSAAWRAYDRESPLRYGRRSLLHHQLGEEFFGAGTLLCATDANRPLQEYGQSVERKYGSVRLDIQKVFPDPYEVPKEVIVQHKQLKDEYVRAITDCFRGNDSRSLISAENLVNIYKPKDGPITLLTEAMGK